MRINKFMSILLALVMLTGVFSFSAYAYTPPEADGGASPSPTSGKQSESAIPKSGNAITPDGTGTVVDKLSSKDGKEFYTITTPDENVFYLVIDTVREDENVYFLNAVTEDDLMALAEKKEDGKDGTSTSAIPATSPAPQETEPSPSPEPQEPPTQNGGGNGTLIFIIIAAIAAGGAGYYFKILRPKQQANYDEPEDDYADYEDSEADNGYESEEESEDDE